MTDRENPTTAVASWVRMGLVAVAVPQAMTGLWAVLDPSGWFRDFPGFDPRLVAADPPYNGHLATDAGAGFLATAVALLLAAWWAERRTVLLAVATYVTLAVPHLAYHAANPAPGLTDAENARNLLTLAAAAALLFVLAWATLRQPPRSQESDPSAPPAT